MCGVHHSAVVALVLEGTLPQLVSPCGCQTTQHSPAFRLFIRSSPAPDLMFSLCNIVLSLTWSCITPQARPGLLGLGVVTSCRRVENDGYHKGVCVQATWICLLHGSLSRPLSPECLLSLGNNWLNKYNLHVKCPLIIF